MRSLPRAGGLAACLIAALAVPALAQSHASIPLIAGVPQFQGPMFSNAHTLAAAGGGKIYVASGLQDPATAAQTFVIPP